jgi:hypothetical protein
MPPLGTSTLPLILVLGCVVAFVAPAAAAAGGPVALVVNADDPAFSWELVQPVMAEAVGAPIVATDDTRARGRRGLLTVTWRPSRRELAVTYEDARGTFSRIVPAPADAAAALSTATALAANLARDQAAEVLGPAAPAPAAPAPPTAPAATVPVVARDPGYAPPVPPSLPLPRWIVSLSLGTGAGVGGGHTDTVAAQATTGLAWSQLGHFVPEVGYRVTGPLVLSLALRQQVITSTTDAKLPMTQQFAAECGGDYVCTAPRTATAMFAKATFADWRPGRGPRPYGSLALGAGQARLPISFPSQATCGPYGSSTCVDTLTNGPVFVGAGGGLRVPVAGGFALIAGLEAFVGAPDLSLNLDLNLGASAAF